MSQDVSESQKLIIEKFVNRIAKITWISPSHSILKSSSVLFKEFWRRHMIVYRSEEYKKFQNSKDYRQLDNYIRDKLYAVMPDTYLTYAGYLTAACIDDILTDEEETDLPFSSPSEPIIRFFERGAHFRREYVTIDIYGGSQMSGIWIPWHRPQGELNKTILLDLSDVALDKLDEENK